MVRTVINTFKRWGPKSMNDSRPDEMVPLTVRAADEGTEIFLIDGNFNRLQSAVGKMKTRVKPGIYKVRFRSGEAQVDRIIEVTDAARGGRNSVEVSGASLNFSSTAPIPGTRTTSEAHEAAWRRAWRRPDKILGDGGGIFLMVRDTGSTSRCDSYSRSRRPWEGVTISDTDGKLLCDLAEDGTHDCSSGVGTVHAALAPGTYVLRVDTSVAGVQKMAVTVCPGWQTQILMAASRYRRSSKGRIRAALRANLADAAVFMVKIGADRDPEEFMAKHLRLTDLARQGMAQGRNPMRPDELHDMLWAKYENPMLGIIGAHLMLRASEPDLDMLHDVVGNLERLVPGHPDALALRLAVNARRNVEMAEAPVCAAPPMLSASWQIIVEQSIKWPNIAPPGSLAARIGFGNLLGSIWFIWGRERSPVKNNESNGKARRIPAPMRLKIANSASQRSRGDDVMRFITTMDALSPLPGQIREVPRQETLAQLLSRVRERFPVGIIRSGANEYPELSRTQRFLVQEVAAQAAAGGDIDPIRIVRRMGMPAAAVMGTARNLLRR